MPETSAAAEFIKPTRRTLIILAATLMVYENVVTVITGGELFTSGPAALTISAILIAAIGLAVAAVVAWRYSADS